MKRLIILIEIIILIILFYLIFTIPKAKAEKEGKYYLMTITAYSRHSSCISDEYNDGFTATMTPIRKGVCAINVDWINGKWIVKSPLKLGQKILIEDLGIFSVEDTGYFTDIDFKQDYWNVDVFEPDHEKAVKAGRKVKKVYILED